ncbi:MAG: hypothetical protein ABSG33_06220 [Candidatus Bathyarchaeia archaeon]|jgi:menaquinone-dependent protoporphyrinogen IX oxidase
MEQQPAHQKKLQSLRQVGMDVRVVNAKEEKVKDIAEYDLVIVGSAIQHATGAQAALLAHES